MKKNAVTVLYLPVVREIVNNGLSETPDGSYLARYENLSVDTLGVEADVTELLNRQPEVEYAEDTPDGFMVSFRLDCCENLND